MYTKFEFGSLKGRNHLGDLDEDERTILKSILIECEDVEWTHLAQVSVLRRGLVNAVMNFRTD
jgi:hypothetical protein